MAQSTNHIFLAFLVAMLLAIAESTPPGLSNPSNARCLDDKYKTCYNLVHVCPKFCPDSCTVNCQSCKPVCANSTTPTPTPTPSPPPPVATPPPVYSSPPPPVATPPPSPPPSTPTPSSPPPSTPVPTPTTPSSPVPTPSTPVPTSTPSSSPKTAKCRNKNYHECYNTEHVCPSACPGGCHVDCVTCKPICSCDQPGAVCQDPRFIGGDGITFYFHGKKEHNFCLVSDSNLHINAHFIGLRNQNMKRDFTWVQSIGILFGKHQLFLAALKTPTWDDAVDRLAIEFDGENIFLVEGQGSSYQSTNLTITRITETNTLTIEVIGSFKITAKVVPITEQESRAHSYGITNEDCFAHLDLGFKFYSLTDEVNGVLGQTYSPTYASRLNVGAKMPLMGGDRKFKSSSLFATDCAVARFNGYSGEDFYDGELELPSLNCESGINGLGVVCKR